MSDKCPNRHFAQNTGKHQQSIYLLAPFSLFELAYDSTLLPLRTLKTYLTSLTACYNWLRHLKSPALSTSPPHWLQPRSDLEVTSLQFSRDSALGGASRSPLCGETGARRSPSNFTGRRRSGTGLAPPPISLSERNGQEVDCQRHLVPPDHVLAVVECKRSRRGTLNAAKQSRSKIWGEAGRRWLWRERSGEQVVVAALVWSSAGGVELGLVWGNRSRPLVTTGNM